MPFQWMNIVGLLIIGLVIASPALFMYISIPLQARKRGYSFWLWFLACVVNIALPIYFLILLPLLPNRARMRLREKFRAELDAKLASAGVSVHVRPLPALATTGSTATVERSLGDMPTIVPRERSLGDDETCG